MSDDDFQWTYECDPHWVDAYLKALRNGELIKVACAIAGIVGSTARRWRDADARNARRHTRALEEGKARTAKWAGDTLKAQAERGSSWHFARYMALKDPDTWKQLNENKREAEPDTDHHDFTGGAAGIIEQRRKADERLDELDSEGLPAVPPEEPPPDGGSVE